jgi:hypothetical protein
MSALDSSMREAIAVPREGRVDWQQLRALIELLLKQGFRPSLLAVKGSRSHPLRQLVVGMTLLGIFFIGNAKYCADPDTFFYFLFTVTFGVVSLCILPDTLDARRRNVEVLDSRPVAKRTLLAARTSLLFMLAGIITVCFGLPPLISTRIFFGCSWGMIAELWLLLVLGSFTVVVLWLTGLLMAAQWFNLDRLRTLAQFALIAVNLSVMGSSLLAMSGVDGLSKLRPMSLAHRPLLHLLPSVWFANVALGDSGAWAICERGGALLLFVFAIYLSCGVDLGKRYPRMQERLLSPDESPVRSPMAVRLLDWTRLHFPGRWLANDQAAAVARLIMIATQRELTSRISVVVPRLLAVVFFIAAFVGDEYAIAPVLLMIYGFMALVDGVHIVKGNPQAAASWLLAATPVEPRDVIRGTRLVIIWKYFAFPGLLTVIVLAASYEPALAAILILCFLVEARCVISLLFAIAPAWPLSREQTTTNSWMSLVTSLVITTISSTAHVVIVTAYEFMSYAGLMLGVMGIAALITLSYLLDRGAASRLAQVDFSH